jgi:hypothetical protein
MTMPRPCPPAPGPLEGMRPGSMTCFTRVAQRQGFREYLAGLLAPRDRNKTLTALAATTCALWLVCSNSDTICDTEAFRAATAMISSKL